MPYPYSNSLGKNLPPDTNHFAQFPIVTYPKKKLPVWAGKKPSQNEMIEALAKEHTLKFPGILPMAVTKDYPGNHPANKWGKPDYTATPDTKVDPYPIKNFAALMEAEMAELEKKYNAKVQGSFSTAAVDPYYYTKGLPALYKPAPQYLGKMLNCYDPITQSTKIRVVLKVEGLSVDDIKFGVEQSISHHAALDMNTDMLSHVLDETFAKMKDEIMRKVIMEATKK